MAETLHTSTCACTNIVCTYKLHPIIHSKMYNNVNSNIPIEQTNIYMYMSPAQMVVMVTDNIIQYIKASILYHYFAEAKLRQNNKRVLLW